MLRWSGLPTFKKLLSPFSGCLIHYNYDFLPCSYRNRTEKYSSGPWYRTINMKYRAAVNNFSLKDEDSKVSATLQTAHCKNVPSQKKFLKQRVLVRKNSLLIHLHDLGLVHLLCCSTCNQGYPQFRQDTSANYCL
jgi:hypothetical protein